MSPDLICHEDLDSHRVESHVVAPSRARLNPAGVLGLLSVALQQLVEEPEFIGLFHRIKWREGVAFVLQNRHLGPVQVGSVGDARHPGVTLSPGLEPLRQDLEELRDQVFFLQRYEHSNENDDTPS